MLGKEYAASVLKMAEQAADSQQETIAGAADMIYASLKEGGLLHVFGCGHSHMLCEECFYRAGGLVPVNPIFESSVMLHEGAVKSSHIERMSGYASLILDNYQVFPGESIIIFSTSGINSLPIEMAMAAKDKGLNVIAFSSDNYDSSMSRDKSGKRLPDLSDIVINTGVPCGDAMIILPRSGSRAVPGSTVVSTVLLNMLVAEVLERYEQDGRTPPVFASGNAGDGLARNQVYIKEYKGRVKSL